ncbi:hypothetical protein [Spirosoma jeollabukense]
MKTNIVMLAILTAFAACQPDPLVPGDKPNDNVDSINVFNRVKMSWAPTDYKEVEYDASKKPIRYTQQNLYNQGTGEVRKVVHNLIYSGMQLTRLDVSDGSYVTYSYDGDKVSRTEEFSANGKLVATRTYQYFPDNRLKRMDEINLGGARKVETAMTFAYDNKGNLIQLVDLTKYPETGTYQVEMVTRYTNYDSKKNVSNLWALYPLLPNVTLQVNNAATVTQYLEGPDGAEMLFHTSQYVYQYNAQDYPTSHTHTDSGGVLTATYSYIKAQ